MDQTDLKILELLQIDVSLLEKDLPPTGTGRY